MHLQHHAWSSRDVSYGASFIAPQSDSSNAHAAVSLRYKRVKLIVIENRFSLHFRNSSARYCGIVVGRAKVGLWRDMEVAEIASSYNVRKSKDHPIDASGTLPDGPPSDSFFQFRDALAEREKAFTAGLIENLVSYALGRPIQFTNEKLCADIQVHARKRGLTLQAIIEALVASRAFQTK